MTHLARAQAEGFYAVPRYLPFLRALVEYMISVPVLAQGPEGEGAVHKNRELMCATAPKHAGKGRLR